MRSQATIEIPYLDADHEVAEADATLRGQWPLHRGKPCRKATEESRLSAWPEEPPDLGAALPGGPGRRGAL